MSVLFKILGAIGLLFITAGVLDKKDLRRNWFFVVGGVGLCSYSIYLRDPIFIPLQIIFTLASLYEIFKFKK
ncbi:MAG: hypothetical protein WCT40_03730 [Candidatus Magasanikbacteria bacterium]|jgi:hypothetical protein